MPALAAALLFWSCPVAVFESTTALIELPLVLFSSLATLSLLEWTSTHEDSLLRLSAVSLGFALGCKYHAAFWIAPFLLVLAFQAPRNDQQAGEGAVSALLRCFRYLCLAGILFLPWMIRAWHYTGNPVFPAANNFFRSPYFPPAMQQAALAAYANEGVGTGLKALLKLPWTATFHPGSFRGTLGFVFLLGTSVALLRCRTRRIRWGVGIAAAYFYTWAFTAQDIRYLLPLAPLLSVIAAAGLLGMECARVAEESPAPAPGGGSRRARVPGLAVVLMSSLISLPCIYPLLVKEWTYWHAYQSPLNYLLGRESAQDFARRDVPSIYVYDYINANLAVGDRILLLNDSAQFYSKVPTLYSFTVEAERLLFEESEQGLLSRLKESRITHVLLNYNGIKPLPGVAPRRGAYFFLDEGFQGRHLVPLFSKNKVVLYQVRG